MERAGREVQLGCVGADEGRGGYELAGALDLDVADVNSCHLVPGGGELPGRRDTAAAADVQDLTVPGEAVVQIGQPTVVSGCSVVVAAVVAGQRVVSGADQVGWVGLHDEQGMRWLVNSVSDEDEARGTNIASRCVQTATEWLFAGQDIMPADEIELLHAVVNRGPPKPRQRLRCCACLGR